LSASAELLVLIGEGINGDAAWRALKAPAGVEYGEECPPAH